MREKERRVVHRISTNTATQVMSNGETHYDELIKQTERNKIVTKYIYIEKERERRKERV